MDNPTSCPKCNSESIIVDVYADTVDFRNLELDVENLERYRCVSCRATWESPSQRANNEAKIKDEYAQARDRLRQKHGLLTAHQIESIRKNLSLTQKEASVLFGGGTNAFNKYESGEVLQSFAMDRLIRLTDGVGKRAVDFLKDVQAPHQLNAGLTQPDTVVVVIQDTGYERSSKSVNYTLTSKFLSKSERRLTLPGTKPPLDGIFIDRTHFQHESLPFQTLFEASP